ncbi:TPA: hypothetical protein EYN98_11690 [Candidatus Poribacteria bacterium]|nr:hypothetical protein [Candidatus Poribacteria bacterium]
MSEYVEINGIQYSKKLADQKVDEHVAEIERLIVQQFDEYAAEIERLTVRRYDEDKPNTIFN